MSIKITDVGDFVDGVYHQQEASSLYSILIGRNVSFPNTKPEFADVDIVKKGYLMKEGAWIKSWKKRYFILRKDIKQICYYPSEDHLALIGSIPLNDSLILWNQLSTETATFKFSLQWNDEVSREQRTLNLEANDSTDLLEWMEAIGNAVVSKEAIKRQEDWWLETFGKEIPKEKRQGGAITTLNAPKIMQEVDDKSKISKPKSYQPPTPSSMMQEEEGSGTEEWLGGGSVVGPGTSHPTSSSNVVTAPTLSQEVHMKSSSQPATDGESQNLTSALQVLSQPSRRVMHAQSGFFFDQDDESNDSDNEITSCEPSGTGGAGFFSRKGIANMQNTDVKNTDQEIEEEEEYIFRTMEEDEAQDIRPLTNKTAPLRDISELPSAPNLEREISAIAAVPVVENHAEKSKSSEMEESSSRSSTKIKKKVKKEKPAEESPFQNPTITRYEVDRSICGIKLAVCLENLVHGNEKLFIVVMVGTVDGNGLETPTKARVAPTSGPGAGGDASKMWRNVSRTEGVKVDELPKNASSTLDNFVAEFNILLDPMVVEDNCTHVMFVLYKAGIKSSEADTMTATNSSDLFNQTALCHCVVRKSILQAKRAIIKVGMKVLVIPQHDVVLNIPTPPQATMGIILLSSAPIFERRRSIAYNLRTNPYAEVLYCYRTNEGQVMVLEQVYAARYSITVATAMLELLIPERRAIIDSVKKVIKAGLRSSLVALKTIPKKMAIRDLDNMMVGNQEGTKGPQMITAVTQAEALQRANSVIKHIENEILESYKDCYEHCSRIWKGNFVQGNIIDVGVGGNVLRRSVWKKSPVWQFSATNLNVNVMTTHTYSVADIKVGSTAPQKDLNSFHSITFGCPAAHELGFHDGGLRRQMQGLITQDSGKRMRWMSALQATGGLFPDGTNYNIRQGAGRDSMLDQIYQHPNEAEALFGSGVDTRLLDGWADTIAKSSKLAMRLDHVCSQVLCFAVAFLKSMFSFAAEGVQLQMAVLANALACQNILIPVQSFLSTQGDEMGMIEDLDAAVCWLNSVKFRIVTELPESEVVARETVPTTGEKEKEKSDKKFSRRVTRRTLTQLDDAREVVVGRCDDVMIRRDEVTENLIVTLQLNKKEMHAVYTAIHTVRSWGVQKDMFSGKTSDPDSMIQTDELDLRERVQSSASASLKLVSEPQIVVWDEGEQGMRVVDTRMKSDALMNIMKLNHSLSNHEDHEFVSLDEITESEHQNDPIEFSLTGVLFNQGINEMQTLANMSGGAFIQRQVEINNESFYRLEKYCNLRKNILQFRRSQEPSEPQKDIASQKKSSVADLRNVKLNPIDVELDRLTRLVDDLRKTLKASQSNSAEKNVGILLKSSAVCRMLSGSSGILCKSGKDRTSMGVTLDQSLDLASNANVVHGKEAIRLMRKHGVRRMNVYANTGQAMYAFNNFQYQMLPKCYRPPPGTHTGKVAA